MAEWETVKRKKRGRGRGAPAQGCCAHAGDDRADPVAPASWDADQAARVAALEKSAWCGRALDALVRAAPAPDRVVCFGLGSIFESRNAQWQLAFLELVSRACGVGAEAYDPILCAAERDALRRRGVGAGAPLGAGAAAPPPRALYFMPHCPMALYAEVLRRHAPRLDGLVIVGNSFASYAARKIGDDMDADIAAALARVVEVAADPGRDSDLERPFNDMAIMSFPAPAEPT